MGVKVTAYSPLGSPGMLGDEVPKIIDIPEIKEIAEAHSVTPAQVCIAWSLQRGVICIPKTMTETRLQENFDSLDVTLTEDEMAKINGLDKGLRNFNPKSFFGGGW